MSTPYFVFSTFLSETDPGMKSWLRFRGHIQTVHPVVGRGEPGTVAMVSETLAPEPAVPAALPGVASYWRLLASNHREVARSYFLYSSFSRARAHVDRMLAGPDELSVVTLMGSDIRTHGWYATLDDVPVMTCSRWYGGTSSAYDAARATLKALRTATIVDGTRRPAPTPAPGGAGAPGAAATLGPARALSYADQES